MLQLSETSAYYRELTDREVAVVAAVVKESKDGVDGTRAAQGWSLPAELQRLGGCSAAEHGPQSAIGAGRLLAAVRQTLRG